MKGLCVAVFSFVVLVGLSAILLRIYRKKKYYRMFLLSFIGAVAAYTYLQFVLPHDLGFLPKGLIEPRRDVDFWTGALLLLLVSPPYLSAAYAAVLTGFSSNLMVLLSRANELSRHEILEIYEARDSLDRLLLWRLNNLLRGRYLRQDGSRLFLTAKGKRLACFSKFLKRVYGVEERKENVFGHPD